MLADLHSRDPIRLDELPADFFNDASGQGLAVIGESGGYAGRGQILVTTKSGYFNPNTMEYGQIALWIGDVPVAIEEYLNPQQAYMRVQSPLPDAYQHFVPGGSWSRTGPVSSPNAVTASLASPAAPPVLAIASVVAPSIVTDYAAPPPVIAPAATPGKRLTGLQLLAAAAVALLVWD